MEEIKVWRNKQLEKLKNQAGWPEDMALELKLLQDASAKMLSDDGETIYVFKTTPSPP